MTRQPSFSFAVIADTHIEAEGGAAPPRANQRTRQVVDALRLRRPGFVIHLGDVIHPLPASEATGAAYEVAAKIFDDLDVPLHYTPGNHDIGDKPQPIMPAALVGQGYLQRWLDRFGHDHEIVDFSGCRLVIFNSPALNADTAQDEALLAWLEDAFFGAEGRRIFLATHYPLFLFRLDEDGHYDNISAPARQCLLELFARFEVEAVFTGHVHWRHYSRLGKTEFHGAPSTSFLRRDFSEIFKTAPIAEHGREDPAKLGFLWVDVFEDRHIARFIRLEDLAPLSDEARFPAHPLDGKWSGLGVDLRHDWCAKISLPVNPPTAPFQRKFIRDDTQLLALCDLGLRDLRIPADDLLDPLMAARAKDISRLGFRFIVSHAGDGAEKRLGTIADTAPFIHAFEIIHRRAQLIELTRGCAHLADRIGAALWLNPLAEPGSAGPGNRIGYGFNAEAPIPDEIRDLAGESRNRSLVFRARATAFTPADAARIADLSRQAGFDAVMLLALSADDMSTEAADDDAFAAAMTALLEIARAHPRMALILDTFMAFDRGYHIRSGLIDRQANPLPAGEVLRRNHSFIRKDA